MNGCAPQTNPRIAFGLQCTSVALAAKCGRVERRAVNRLASMAFRMSAQDRDVAAALAAFFDGIDRNPTGSGAVLLEWVNGWIAATAPEPAPYAWQEKADLS